ncbi:MAG: quinone-dependent dihydroorotate dehydrogenase [Oleiphilaceae bacterium]|nr:quinone-dependent dihydroorotate dehydrogenase [Oleiphilaceae bacterium]
MLFSLSRSLLFRLPPEKAHQLSLGAAAMAHKLGLIRLFWPRPEGTPVRVMGLDFPNAVGLAAGLDKNGDYIDALGDLGFGFLEIGTVTPRPQPGNPQPRLFRVPEHQAIINRMGFNNQGLEALVANVRASSFQRQGGILGINVGKNRDTPVEKAAEDYVTCIEGVYELADYLTINVSSPNTPGLRDLQQGDSLNQLLSRVSQTREGLHRITGRYVPIAVKIAPDMDEAALEQLAAALLEHGMDGVIATNTTLSREALGAHPLAQEQGGLSGGPLASRANEVTGTLQRILQGRLPIIGVGGIVDGDSAAARMHAGASLVQLYSGLIYRGPALIREAVAATEKARS